MEKLVKIGILFDFYGKLLTDKQYMAIDLYYINDLSLAEIGEGIGVSRQGVFDILKRAENKLFGYEDKLHLVKKFKDNHEGIKTIIDNSYKLIELVEVDNKNKAKEILEENIKIGKKLVTDKEV